MQTTYSNEPLKDARLAADRSRREVLGAMLAGGAAPGRAAACRPGPRGPYPGLRRKHRAREDRPWTRNWRRPSGSRGACDYFPARFTPNQRAKVKPWDLTPEKLAAAGLIRETWTLDVVSQDQKNSLAGKAAQPGCRQCDQLCRGATSLRAAASACVEGDDLPERRRLVQLRRLGGRGAAGCPLAGEACRHHSPHCHPRAG